MAEPGSAAPAPRQLGRIAAFFTALVAFNTLAFSCSNDRIAREAADLQRFASDERFWTEAMHDLGTLVAERYKPGYNEASWDAQCKLLALRTSPFSFDPTGGDGGSDTGREQSSPRAKADAARIELLKLAFAGRMQDRSFVSEGCRATFERRQFSAAQADSRAAAPDIPVAVPAPATVAPPVAFRPDTVTSAAIAQRATIIALTPPSTTGWDIDVFWCDRDAKDAADRNYADALGVAQLLAGFAQSGERIGGESLGRVRARILPVERQGRQLFPSRGAEIRADGGAGEAALAAALRAALPAYGFEQKGSRRATRWYLSMFLCRAPELPPIPAAKAGA